MLIISYDITVNIDNPNVQPLHNPFIDHRFRNFSRRELGN